MASPVCVAHVLLPGPLLWWDLNRCLQISWPVSHTWPKSYHAPLNGLDAFKAKTLHSDFLPSSLSNNLTFVQYYNINLAPQSLFCDRISAQHTNICNLNITQHTNICTLTWTLSNIPTSVPWPEEFLPLGIIAGTGISKEMVDKNLTFGKNNNVHWSEMHDGSWNLNITSSEIKINI